MAIETGLSMFAGEDIDVAVQILDDEQVACIDISGWDLSFQVRASIDSTDALLTKTTDDDIAIEGTFNTSPTTSTQRAVVTFASGDTDDYEDSVAFWELKRTDSNKVLAYGQIEFRVGVHHP
jgi:hypothetical protein